MLEVHWIKKADKRLEKIDEYEIEEKIELIHSYGYFYNPYVKEFHNFFNNKLLKAAVVFNLSKVQIQQLINDLEPEKPLKNLEEVKFEIYGVDNFSPFRHFVEVSSGILGSILLIVSVILYFNSNIGLSVIFASFSFILTKYYVSDNLIYELYYPRSLLSPLWQKFQGVFIIQNLIMYPYLLFQYYLLLDSILIPIIGIIIAHHLIQKICFRKKAKEYWRGIFWGKITEFSERYN